MKSSTAGASTIRTGYRGRLCCKNRNYAGILRPIVPAPIPLSLIQISFNVNPEGIPEGRSPTAQREQATLCKPARTQPTGPRRRSGKRLLWCRSPSTCEATLCILHGLCLLSRHANLLIGRGFSGLCLSRIPTKMTQFLGKRRHEIPGYGKTTSTRQNPANHHHASTRSLSLSLETLTS